MDGRWLAKYAINAKGKIDHGDRVSYPVVIAADGVMNDAYRPPEEAEAMAPTAAVVPYYVPDHPPMNGPEDEPVFMGWRWDDEKFPAAGHLDTEVAVMRENGRVRIKTRVFIFKINKLGQDQSELIEEHDDGTYRNVSIGYRYEPDAVKGEWEGQAYQEVERNIQIGHLAGLREVPPACEAPTCGIGVASRKSATDSCECPSEKDAEDTFPKGVDENMADDKPAESPPSPLQQPQAPTTPPANDQYIESLKEQIRELKEQGEKAKELETKYKETETQLKEFQAKEAEAEAARRKERREKLEEIIKKVHGDEKAKELFPTELLDKMECEEIERHLASLEPLAEKGGGGSPPPKADPSLKIPPAGGGGPDSDLVKRPPGMVVIQPDMSQ